MHSQTSRGSKKQSTPTCENGKKRKSKGKSGLPTERLRSEGTDSCRLCECLAGQDSRSIQLHVVALRVLTLGTVLAFAATTAAAVLPGPETARVAV